MIIGAHAILYSDDPDGDRAFLRDVLGFPNVDVGQGWLIFGLPPSEVAVHPVMEGASKHELYLMVDDVDGFVADMKAREVACSDVQEAPWGRLVAITLPSGSELGVYQPLHERPEFPTSV